MIRKFNYGYLINNKTGLVFNIYKGTFGNCNKDNAVFKKENPLLAPDIISWWQDD